jgi:hypothetical protein
LNHKHKLDIEKERAKIKDSNANISCLYHSRIDDLNAAHRLELQQVNAAHDA